MYNYYIDVSENLEAVNLVNKQKLSSGFSSTNSILMRVFILGGRRNEL